MACLPLEPIYSKALILSSQFNCLEEMLIAVAMLSVESIFYAPRDKLEEFSQRKHDEWMYEIETTVRSSFEITHDVFDDNALRFRGVMRKLTYRIDNKCKVNHEAMPGIVQFGDSVAFGLKMLKRSLDGGGTTRGMGTTKGGKVVATVVIIVEAVVVSTIAARSTSIKTRKVAVVGGSSTTDESRAALRCFSSPEGDHLTLLNVYRSCAEFLEKSKMLNKEKAEKNLRKWCKENFINSRSLRHARDIHSQIRANVEQMGLCVTSCGEDMLQLRRCLAASFFLNAALKQPDGAYRNLEDTCGTVSGYGGSKPC
ncbi:hypothetical protein RJ639_042368 [Escallonia herrerae]|uniref:RNA helicase n=1 Tax=Escallonia herrerae TaxID=1293975 RepID=A0AA89B4M4_9ASTE|nr:hypothetical protein RJ639_042368 [Escallonia herrerae]